MEKDSEDLRGPLIDLMQAIMEREPGLANVVQHLIQRVNQGDNLTIVIGHLTHALRDEGELGKPEVIKGGGPQDW